MKVHTKWPRAVDRTRTGTVKITKVGERKYNAAIDGPKDPLPWGGWLSQPMARR